jgi:hypothetical protein
MKGCDHKLNDASGDLYCGKALAALTLRNFVRECAYAFTVIFLKVEHGTKTFDIHNS